MNKELENQQTPVQPSGKLRGALSLVVLLTGAALFRYAGQELEIRFPTIQDSHAAMIEGAVLRMSILPLFGVLMFILFREWIVSSGFRKLLSGVQWLILVLVVVPILTQPWEILGTFAIEIGHLGGPYRLSINGIIIAATCFFLTQSLVLLVISQEKKSKNKITFLFMDYGPILIFILLTTFSLWWNEKPEIRF